MAGIPEVNVPQAGIAPETHSATLLMAIGDSDPRMDPAGSSNIAN